MAPCLKNGATSIYEHDACHLTRLASALDPLDVVARAVAGLSLPGGFYRSQPHGHLTEPGQVACVEHKRGEVLRMSLRAYSLKDASEVTGLAYKTILSATNRGELVYFMPYGGKRKRFVREDELKRWIRSMEKQKTPPAASET